MKELHELVNKVVKASRAYMQVKGGEGYSGLSILSSQSDNINLTAETGRSRLEQVVESVEVKQLLGGLRALWKGEIDSMGKLSSLDYLRGLFDGFESKRKRERVIEEVLELLNADGNQRQKVHDGVLRMLNQEINRLDSTSQYIPLLLNGLTGDFRISFELFPLLIANASDVQERTQWFTTIYDIEWNETSIMSFISVLREIQMNPTEQTQFLTKIFQQIKRIELETLPALIYQALLFIGSIQTKRKPLNDLVLELNTLETQLQDSICSAKRDLISYRTALATILAHFNFVMKQDHAIGQAFLTLMKTQELTFTSVALLVSMGAMKQYEQRVLDLLARRSPIQMLQSVVSDAKYGYEHILQIVVKYATRVRDSKLLLHIFHFYDMVQSYLFEHMLTRIAQNGDDVEFFIQVFAHVTMKYASQVVNELDRLKSAMDYITTLEKDTAMAFLRATQPIWQLRPQLLDHLMLILRKAAFSREETQRCIAIEGFFVLIAFESELFSQLTALLRRSLTQQATVRKSFYQGAQHVFESKPILRQALWDLVYPHFSSFYHENPLLPPLQVEKCIDNKTEQVIEPLPHLLNCLFTFERIESDQRFSLVIPRLDQVDLQGPFGTELCQVLINHMTITTKLETNESIANVVSLFEKLNAKETNVFLFSSDALIRMCQKMMEHEEFLQAGFTYLLTVLSKEDPKHLTKALGPVLVRFLDSNGKDKNTSQHVLLTLILNLMKAWNQLDYFLDLEPDGLTTSEDCTSHFLSLFQVQFTKAINAKSYKEADVSVQILLVVMQHCRESNRDMKWIESVCQDHVIPSKPLVIRLIRLFLTTATQGEGLVTITRELESYFNENTSTFKVFSTETITQAIFPVILEEMEKEKQINVRMIECWRYLLNIQVIHPSRSVGLVKSLIKFYKKITALIKQYSKDKRGILPDEIKPIFQNTAREISPAALAFVSAQNGAIESEKATGNNKTKTSAEQQYWKLVPDLICQIEQVDVSLIKWLPREFRKSVNRRQARDFRLNTAQLQEQMRN